MAQFQAPKGSKLARKQVDAPVTGREEAHAPGTVNIWTGRPLKEFRPRREERTREASKYRCMPKVDMGWTRGEGTGASYCCLYFARGLCHHGADCNYLHRVPTHADEVRHGGDYGHDIFGRERAPASRDGRKRGVGSYERECRTLYVNYGGAGPTPVLQLRKLLEENFGEWGPVENIHIVPDKTIAFVRYSWRSSAEFAKAAMHQQRLLGSSMSEVLDVRWANDDPNPRAVVRVKREREEAFRDAYLQAVMELPPDQKAARLQQLNLQANVRPGATTSQYPDTDAQYGGSYHHSYQGWDQLLYQQAPPAAGSSEAYNEQAGAEAEEGDWDTSYDPDLDAAGGPWEQQQAYLAPRGPSGAAWQGVDDVSRYLPPEELRPPVPSGGGGAGAGRRQQQEQQQQQPGSAANPVSAGTQQVSAEQRSMQTEPAADAGAAASTHMIGGEAPAPLGFFSSALGMLGGYGSGSEEDEDG